MVVEFNLGLEKSENFILSGKWQHWILESLVIVAELISAFLLMIDQLSYSLSDRCSEFKVSINFLPAFPFAISLTEH